MNLEVVWTQAEETARAKSAQREPQRSIGRDGPTTTDRIAFWLETHPDATSANISAATGINRTDTSDCLFRLKRAGRIVPSHNQYDWPRRPITWRIVE